MSVSDLRKELKDMRKKVSPTPVSRMKKSDCAAEIERLRSVHRGEVTKVAEVLTTAEVPAKVKKTVKAVQEVAHSKGESSVKKTMGVSSKSAPAKAPATKTAPKKESKAGSEEMKARMAKLREMRKAKKDA